MWSFVLEILFQHLRGGTEENSEISFAGSRYHGRDFNPTPLEYKFRVYSFTSLLYRYVFSLPAVLNILLVRVSLRIRYQVSLPGVSFICRCVLDNRQIFALKYSIFLSTTNKRCITQQDLFVDTVK